MTASTLSPVVARATTIVADAASFLDRTPRPAPEFVAFVATVAKASATYSDAKDYSFSDLVRLVGLRSRYEDASRRGIVAAIAKPGKTPSVEVRKAIGDGAAYLDRTPTTNLATFGRFLDRAARKSETFRKSTTRYPVETVAVLVGAYARYQGAKAAPAVLAEILDPAKVATGRKPRAPKAPKVEAPTPVESVESTPVE